MTENTERSQLDALDELSMAQLRAAAKLMKISAQRDWGKEAFVQAIKDKQAKQDAVEFVVDGDIGPKPGFARILIHRDPTPKAKNSAVPVGFNGQLYLVPRGIEVDIPKEFVEVLKNASYLAPIDDSDNSSGDLKSRTQREERQQSYPFTVTSITPGTWKNPNDQRAAHYKLREEFMKKLGHWPTAAELKEAQKAKLISQFKE